MRPISPTTAPAGGGNTPRSAAPSSKVCGETRSTSGGLEAVVKASRRSLCGTQLLGAPLRHWSSISHFGRTAVAEYCQLFLVEREGSNAIDVERCAMFGNMHTGQVRGMGRVGSRRRGQARSFRRAQYLLGPGIHNTHEEIHFQLQPESQI